MFQNTEKAHFYEKKHQKTNVLVLLKKKADEKNLPAKLHHEDAVFHRVTGLVLT